MRVNIWDLDFYYKKANINFLCMKISSFHKQKGDSVLLITRDTDLKTQYDIMYITKEDESIVNPPIGIMMNEKVKIFGGGLQFLTNWVPSNIILACRPDYLLYPDLGLPHQDDDLLQFCSRDNKLLPLWQNAANAKTDKYSLIIDQNLWLLSTEDLKKLFTLLKGRRNINFFYPISLKRLLSDRELTSLFLSLHFRSGVTFEWKNTYKLEKENISMIITFFKTFKKMHPAVLIGNIQFDPLNGKDPWSNFEDILYLIDSSKNYNLQIKLKPLKNRFDTIYYHIFELLIRWTNKRMLNYSFMEYITFPGQTAYKCTAQEIYANEKLWTNESFRAALDWVRRYYEKHGDVKVFLHQYGDNYYNYSYVNWSFLKEKVWF